MKLSKSAVAALAFVLPLAVVAAQEQGPPMPKPGPAHEFLKMDLGTWDATVEVVPGPGAPPMTSKGVEVNTLGCGGLCLISDFKGELMPGVQFHGHGTTTWDAAKNKYVGSWTDSMSTGLSIVEGTWDPAAKKFRGTMEGPDVTGKVVKTRSVVDYSGGSRVMTAFAPGPDGKEMQVLKITYKKK